MRHGALVEAGVITRLVDPSPERIEEVKEHLRRKFLSDPEYQERAFAEYMLRNQELFQGNRALRRVGQQVIGADGRTFTITVSGLMAAAHRQGGPTVKDYLDHMRDVGWRSDPTTYPADPKTRQKYQSIETRLREFQDVPYASPGVPDPLLQIPPLSIPPARPRRIVKAPPPDRL